jgi:hypothetical protein
MKYVEGVSEKKIGVGTKKLAEFLALPESRPAGTKFRHDDGFSLMVFYV